jgi:hypothetical protein
VEPTGLTQMWIAKADTPVHRLVGHKRVSREELRAHGVRFVFHNDLPPVPMPAELRFDEMIVGDALRVEILRYEDDDVMRSLAADRRVHFRRIGSVLSEAEKDIGEMGCEDARATHATLRAFYLASHPDEDARFVTLVAARCAAP